MGTVQNNVATILQLFVTLEIDVANRPLNLLHGRLSRELFGVGGWEWGVV